MSTDKVFIRLSNPSSDFLNLSVKFTVIKALTSMRRGSASSKEEKKREEEMMKDNIKKRI